MLPAKCPAIVHYHEKRGREKENNIKSTQFSIYIHVLEHKRKNLVDKTAKNQVPESLLELRLITCKEDMLKMQAGMEPENWLPYKYKI